MLCTNVALQLEENIGHLVLFSGILVNRIELRKKIANGSKKGLKVRIFLEISIYWKTSRNF
jgi:hypothetical protein